jgi:hypothetical protein
MIIRTFSILIIPVSLFLFGSVIDPAYGASIDEALKTLKGLTGNERLTRIENEARKAAFVGHHRLLNPGLSRHSRYSENVIPQFK